MCSTYRNGQYRNLWWMIDWSTSIYKDAKSVNSIVGHDVDAKFWVNQGSMFMVNLPWEVLYADDLVIMAVSREGLSMKLENSQSGMEAKGLSMNRQQWWSVIPMLALFTSLWNICEVCSKVYILQTGEYIQVVVVFIIICEGKRLIEQQIRHSTAKSSHIKKKPPPPCELFRIWPQNGHSLIEILRLLSHRNSTAAFS